MHADIDAANRLFRLSVFLVAFLLTFSATAKAADFQTWLAGFRQEAAAAGISESTLEAALAGLEPIQRVLELDRSQPEFTQTFWDYLDRRVTPPSVERGRRLLRQYHKLVRRIHARYGVPPHMLVALWGMETRYGDYQGRYPTIAALATLAHDERRREFFQNELIDALRILDQGHVSPEAMIGSWAGAMGHVQFMPSTFTRYAVDENRDGRKDIWRTPADALASGASYLHDLGWKRGETWGREVRLPEDFDWRLARPEVAKPVRDWAALGVRQADDTPLPTAGRNARIVLPQGARGPAFLVYRNFEAIMQWNRSLNYALAVGILADRLIGLPPPRLGRDAENRPLSREEIEEIQHRLNLAGCDAGDPDGVAGTRTCRAVFRFQQAVGLPADGYPSVGLLEYLRTRTEAPARGVTQEQEMTRSGP
jgi:membrane-bound lytic murein transglycosylase B